MHIKGQAATKEYMISLWQTVSSLHRYLNQKVSFPLNAPVQPFQSGDTVYTLPSFSIHERTGMTPTH